MNYTKGEWKTQEIQRKAWDNGYYALLCNGDEEIAIVYDEANANLIAASPKMYEALKAQHEAIDILFAMLIGRDKQFYPSKSGRPWEAMLQGNQALAKAEGGVE